MKEISSTLNASLPPGQQVPLLLLWIPREGVESSSCLFVAHTKDTQQLVRVRCWICYVCATDLHSGTSPPQTVESYEQRQDWHFSLASNLLTAITGALFWLRQGKGGHVTSSASQIAVHLFINLFLSTSSFSQVFGKLRFSCINIKIVLDFKLHTHTAKRTWENMYIELCFATGLSKKHKHIHFSLFLSVNLTR